LEKRGRETKPCYMVRTRSPTPRHKQFYCTCAGRSPSVPWTPCKSQEWCVTHFLPLSWLLTPFSGDFLGNNRLGSAVVRPSTFSNNNFAGLCKDEHLQLLGVEWCVANLNCFNKFNAWSLPSGNPTWNAEGECSKSCIFNHLHEVINQLKLSCQWLLCGRWLCRLTSCVAKLFEVFRQSKVKPARRSFWV